MSLVIVLFLALFAAGFGWYLTIVFNYDSGNMLISPEAKKSADNSMDMEESLLAPTGNIDDAVNAILGDALGEQILSDESGDSVVDDALSDTQEVDNFGQSFYDETL